jgi:hypothetical protein
MYLFNIVRKSCIVKIPWMLTKLLKVIPKAKVIPEEGVVLEETKSKRFS